MLKKLTDHELMSSTKRAIEVETKATANVVRHFFEINERELHLKSGQSSLFSFITDEFGLDSTSVQRRVNAVELAKSVPAVLQLIDEGRLQLSSAADIQTFLNAERGRKNPFSDQHKADLVCSLLDLSTREIEKRLAAKNPQVRFSDSRKLISENQYRVIYVTRVETEEKLEQLRNLRSHVHPYATRDELINDICEIALEKIDPVRKSNRTERKAERDKRQPPGQSLRRNRSEDGKSKTIRDDDKTRERNSDHFANSATHEDSVPASEVQFVEEVSELGEVQLAVRFETKTRYISAHERRKLFAGNVSCSFRSGDSGSVCGSRFQLQFDHVQNFSEGGSNASENLQFMCAKHNRYKYRNRMRA